MDTLPKALVDKIIDELASSGPGRPADLARYSTISRDWVGRIQSHTFEVIYLLGPEVLKKWCRNIKSSPTGVSQHTRYLILEKIPMDIKEFEAHIRAFMYVGRMDITKSTFLLSSSAMKCFAPMVSSLTMLKIHQSPTTLRIITSMLVELPKLKILDVEGLKITGDMDGTSSPSEIPFFHGSNSLRLRYSDFGQHDLDWIPSSAQFGELEIDPTHFLHIPAPMNRWLSNSRMTLTALAVIGDPDPCPIDEFTRINLSICDKLATLEVSVGLCRPGSTIETILSSITVSRRLSTIRLNWEDLGEEEEGSEIDYSAWEVTESHLLRLAEYFSTKNPGEKMKVEIYFSHDPGDLRVQVGSEFLSKLRDKANVTFYRDK